MKWYDCTHEGIGELGCPTCDARLDPEARGYMWSAREEIARLRAEAQHKEQMDRLWAEMNAPGTVTR